MMKIDDVATVVDADGKAITDLFNANGSLLISQGSAVPKRISTMAVFTNRVVKKEDDHAAQPPDIPQLYTEEEIRRTMKYLKERFGGKVMARYTETSDAIKEIMEDDSPLTKKKYSTARDIVNETMAEDSSDLCTVIQYIRDVDTYTFNHSLSVYLLFVKAMQDLRKYKDNKQFLAYVNASRDRTMFDDEAIENYALGALLHDYGKTRVSPDILHKAGPLTNSEFAEMKKHPLYGVQDLRRIGVHDANILSIVGNHHAKYMALPQSGQSLVVVISNIIDIYDACRSKRPYKNPYSYEKTIEILQDEGEHLGWSPFIFDVIISDTFKRVEASREKLD